MSNVNDDDDDVVSTCSVLTLFTISLSTWTQMNDIGNCMQNVLIKCMQKCAKKMYAEMC